MTTPTEALAAALQDHESLNHGPLSCGLSCVEPILAAMPGWRLVPADAVPAPQTEAGERWAESPDWWFLDGERDQARACIAAIEAEAVAAERARIAEAVRGLPYSGGHMDSAWNDMIGATNSWHECGGDIRAAVLAIVERTP